jgi:hypothetical protein
MDLWSRFAQYIPTGADRQEIKSLLAAAATKTDDERAAANIDLWNLYRKKATQNAVLAVPFRRLARQHLEEAVLWSKLLPQPMETLAGLQIQEGRLSDALSNLAQAVVRRLDLMKRGRMSKDPQRLDLCQTLTLGGEILSRFGRFDEGRDWLSQALMHFEVLATGIRGENSALEDEILFGITFCLQQEFKYQEALDLITSKLTGEMFAIYQSGTRRNLRALGSVLSGLVEATRGFQFPASGARLWAEAMEDIQRCETPESARQVKREILTKIRTHDVNKEVRKFGEEILAILEKQRGQIEQNAPPPLINIKPIKIEAADVSSIKDPEWRETIRKATLAAAAIEEAKRRANEKAYQLALKVHKDALEMNRRIAARVRQASQRAYHVPAGFWVRWVGLNALRFVVQLVTVGYLVEKVIHKLVEENGKRLLERLRFEPHEAVLAFGVLVLGFVVGGIAEKKIDEAALDRYKEMLKELVTGRMHALWTSYNALLKTYAQTFKAEDDIPPAAPATPQSVA